MFTNQNWDGFTKSHAQDIIVYWPDGHHTKGLKSHIEDLKSMFVYAPDTRIQEHPVRIASGEWTSVIGVMEGTFTEHVEIIQNFILYHNLRLNSDKNYVEPHDGRVVIRIQPRHHIQINTNFLRDYLVTDSIKYDFAN